MTMLHGRQIEAIDDFMLNYLNLLILKSRGNRNDDFSCKEIVRLINAHPTMLAFLIKYLDCLPNEYQEKLIHSLIVRLEDLPCSIDDLDKKIQFLGAICSLVSDEEKHRIIKHFSDHWLSESDDELLKRLLLTIAPDIPNVTGNANVERRKASNL